MSEGDGDHAKEATDDLRSLIRKLPDFLDYFERKHPNWKPATLLSLLRSGLSELKKHLDDPNDDLGWENPFKAFRIPFELAGSISEGITYTCGRINPEQVRDREQKVATFTSVALQCLQISLLHEMVDFVAGIEEGEGFRPLLIDEKAELLNTIGDESERDRVLRQLFWPISFGAGSIEYPSDSNGDIVVNDDVQNQLSAIRAPLISLPLRVNRHKMRLITILEINPPMLDLDTMTGYFPVTVGVALQMVSKRVPANWYEQKWAHLENWSAEEVENVWRHLYEVCDSVFAELGFNSKEEYREVIITINARISGASDQAINRAISEAKASLQNVGNTVSLKTNIVFDAPTLGIDLAEGWMPLLSAVENAKTNADKGQSLERLLIALFSSVPGFEISSNVRTQTEEIDLWIANNSESPPFSKEQTEILAECKNWSGKVGKNEYVSFKEKLKNRKQRCTIGFLISWKGFAKTIKAEILRTSQEELLVALLDGQDICRAVKAGNFLPALNDARRRALSH